MRVRWGYRLHLRFCKAGRTVLGKPAGEGERPVRESKQTEQDPEYRGTRETLQGSERTTPKAKYHSDRWRIVL